MRRRDSSGRTNLKRRRLRSNKKRTSSTNSMDLLLLMEQLKKSMDFLLSLLLSLKVEVSIPKLVSWNLESSHKKSLSICLMMLHSQSAIWPVTAGERSNAKRTPLGSAHTKMMPSVHPQLTNTSFWLLTLSSKVKTTEENMRKQGDWKDLSKISELTISRKSKVATWRTNNLELQPTSSTN